MRRLYIQDNWPDSWKYSYRYDLEEVYSEITHRGNASTLLASNESCFKVVAPCASFLELD